MILFKKERIEIEDQELLEQFRRTGDITVATDLYSKYVEMVYGLCMKYLKEEQKSKDAVMAIYELTIEKIKLYEIEYFKTWLYTVSKNHCLGVLRKSKKLKKEEKEYSKLRDSETEYYHPIGIDPKEEQLSKLENCLENLILTQKQCIDLFYLQKQSYKAISNQLNMSWSRVRSLIQNGRRNLKICLEQS